MAISVQTLQHNRQQRLADERGCQPKPWGGRQSIALIYPNHYYHAMSNLGFQGVYQLIQQRDDCLCERFFLPDREELELYRQTGSPLLSFESQRPVSDFDVVAFSLSFENDYVHLPTLFELTRLPLWRSERHDHHPLVIAGGICALLNPEPVADLIDLFVIGEAEVLLNPLLDQLAQQPSRQLALSALSRKAGYYVPQYYHPRYAQDHTLAAVDVDPPAAYPVLRCWLKDLNLSRCRSDIQTPHTAFGTMKLVEVSRGCSRGCRFCATGFVYLPPREKTAATVLEQVPLEQCAGTTAGLVGAAVSDYSALEQVSRNLIAAGGDVSVASLRIDTMTRQQVQALKQSGQKTLALAPEAGSQRMRDLINKHLTEQQIVDAVALLAEEGILNLKLYFLIGLPTEQEEDIDELLALTARIRHLWIEHQKPLGRLGCVTLSLNPFVPKPMTPFQWCGMEAVNSLKRKINRIRKQINRLSNTELQVESLRAAELQAVLARGDRRVAQILPELAAGKNLKAACRQHQLDSTFYAQRQRDEQELLPWQVIDSGVRTSYLWHEYQNALVHRLSGPCRTGCSRCGICHKSGETT